MCKLGDIIVIDEFIGEDGIKIQRHSFVVINDKPGFIEGMRYDFVANIMSSFKSKRHKYNKLRFEENLEIISDSIISKFSKNNKKGFIKANQLFYFDKNKIKYYVMGRISDDLLDDLIILIIFLTKKGKLKDNIFNIKV